MISVEYMTHLCVTEVSIIDILCIYVVLHRHTKLTCLSRRRLTIKQLNKILTAYD